MPELPEVETLCNQLKKIILNKAIQDIKIFDSKLAMIDEAVGQKITDVTRRGKALEMHLTGKTCSSARELHQENVLVIHLRMSGRLLWQNDRQDLPAHTRFTIVFAKGRLVCIDPRRFATLVMRKDHPGVVVMDNPLRRCSAHHLSELTQNRRLPVKSFLMDQRIISGIGNIYACEILHAASVNPWRKVCGLSFREWKGIAAAAKRILKRAVACRGTTVSDWRDLFGRKGEYQEELSVYAREGYPCQRCHGFIERGCLSGRGTYFCSSCQK